jgi:hypothetical protein
MTEHCNRAEDLGAEFAAIADREREQRLAAQRDLDAANDRIRELGAAFKVAAREAERKAADLAAERERMQRVETLRNDWRDRAEQPDIGRPELVAEAGPVPEGVRDTLRTVAARLSAALADPTPTDAEPVDDSDILQHPYPQTDPSRWQRRTDAPQEPAEAPRSAVEPIAGISDLTWDERPPEPGSAAHTFANMTDDERERFIQASAEWFKRG